MKQADSWNWPDRERHMIDWIASPKGRMILNGRPSYQGKKQLAALDLCPMTNRRTFIDVGGHIGMWSYNFAHWFSAVHAFEPVAEHRECFTANVLVHGGYKAKTVLLHPVALGEREAMISIHTDASSTGDSRVSGAGQIPMTTLDHFRFDDGLRIQDVDLIKIDCEGYEEYVLRGAEATLKEWKPAVVVEQKRDMALRFNLKPLGAVIYLKSLGYETVNEISGDFFMKHKG